jgi:glutaredoxin
MSNQSSITLYTLKGCPHCAAIKLALSKYGITYKEISWNDKEGEKIINSLKLVKVPALSYFENGHEILLREAQDIVNWARNQ